MNRQVELLKTSPNGELTRQFYITVYNTYVEEFGLAWVLKEIDEARKEVIKRTAGKKYFTGVYSCFKYWDDEIAKGGMERLVLLV